MIQTKEERMSEEKEETQPAQQTQGTQEKQGALEAALAGKDALIADLQGQLKEAKQAAESLRAEGVAVCEARDRAVSRYLEATRALNSAIPGSVIVGQTIEEIDASVEKARAIADAVRAGLEARAREARVPAGAPARVEVSLEGLSAREKISAGIQQKGGT
jgi:chromosome segregation ATPase